MVALSQRWTTSTATAYLLAYPDNLAPPLCLQANVLFLLCTNICNVLVITLLCKSIVLRHTSQLLRHSPPACRDALAMFPFANLPTGYVTTIYFYVCWLFSRHAYVRAALLIFLCAYVMSSELCIISFVSFSVAQSPTKQAMASHACTSSASRSHFHHHHGHLCAHLQIELRAAQSVSPQHDISNNATNQGFSFVNC